MAGGSTKRGRERGDEMLIGEMVKNWPTADTNASSYSNGLMGENLREAGMKWATAQAFDGTTIGQKPKPITARHTKGGCSTLADNLRDFPSTAQDETTGPLGLLLRRWTPPECPRLNPVFQWWLMGWPRPATLLSATHRCSGSAATAWTAWRLQLQSQLCSLMQGLEINQGRDVEPDDVIAEVTKQPSNEVTN